MTNEITINRIEKTIIKTLTIAEINILMSRLGRKINNVNISDYHKKGWYK